MSVVVVALLSWYGYYIAKGLPSLEELENPKPALASKVYAEDGAVLDQFAEQNRTRIALAKLPQGLLDALIATEDKDFYNHWGVNLPRFVRQMVINVVTFRGAGASTLTQQLARNLYRLQGREESLFDKITGMLANASRQRGHSGFDAGLPAGPWAVAAGASAARSAVFRFLDSCLALNPIFFPTRRDQIQVLFGR